MKCKYCGTEPNNATTVKGLYVCSCYMLYKEQGIYVQHTKDGNIEIINTENNIAEQIFDDIENELCVGSDILDVYDVLDKVKKKYVGDEDNVKT